MNFNNIKISLHKGNINFDIDLNTQSTTDKNTNKNNIMSQYMFLEIMYSILKNQFGQSKSKMSGASNSNEKNVIVNEKEKIDDKDSKDNKSIDVLKPEKHEKEAQNEYDQRFKCPIDFSKKETYGFFTFNVQEGTDTEDTQLQKIYEFDKMTSAEIINLHRNWTKIIYPDDLEVVRQAHLEAYRSGFYKTKFRVRLPISNGIIWIQTCGNVIFDMKGNPQAIVGLNAVIPAPSSHS